MRNRSTVLANHSVAVFVLSLLLSHHQVKAELAVESLLPSDNAELTHTFTPSGPLRDERDFGDYVVRIYREHMSSFEILHQGIRVHSGEGFKFRIGSIYEERKTNSLITMGADITGDGIPNLVISEWTGGGHCCYFFHVFELGEDFRHIQTIDAGHSDLADFRDVNGDRALEFPLFDWTFAYWRTSFAGSPAPRVILKYNGEYFAPSADLMRQPGLTVEELVETARSFKSSEEWASEPPPVELWSTMLNLIYTGNMEQAWTLFDLTWPEGVDGKDQFREEFKLRLARSPYWDAVFAFNQKDSE